MPKTPDIDDLSRRPNAQAAASTVEALRNGWIPNAEVALRIHNRAVMDAIRGELDASDISWLAQSCQLWPQGVVRDMAYSLCRDLMLENDTADAVLGEIMLRQWNENPSYEARYSLLYRITEMRVDPASIERHLEGFAMIVMNLDRFAADRRAWYRNAEGAVSATGEMSRRLLEISERKLWLRILDGLSLDSLEQADELLQLVPENVLQSSYPWSCLAKMAIQLVRTFHGRAIANGLYRPVIA